jgi:novobiocin biosynthesis protein NovU/D-mycarose 3-C-methyltransferase
VDPATGPVKRAQEWGLNVVDEPFSRALAIELADGFVQRPGVVVLNHVLAHVEDVSDVLAGAALLVADDGVVYVEVQYLPDLLLNNAFDLVYHEHRNFFSLTSLSRALEQHGLYVAAVEQTDRQGGSIRVQAVKRRVSCHQRDYLLAQEAWLRDLVAYRGFQGRAERVRDRLLNLLSHHDVMGFGAPAKATTLLHFCGLDDAEVSHVTDTTLAKQGRFIPNTGIEIRPPYAGAWHEQTVLLLAWNYAADVLKRDLGVEKWIVPLPVPTVL